ncbi:MAG: hypothetical protein KatS3mg017_0129 [Fimbriimonadales bacterium]|nr:MAG: hypothetical protein KatS3mg017_0129 [Fimbriimonadales bacterium]
MCGGGVNTNNTEFNINPPTETAYESSLSATLATALLQNTVTCPPDVPIVTLPNGDVTRDGTVDDADLLQVQFQMGNQGGDADLDGNGVVDDADLMIVMFAQGQSSDSLWQGSFTPAAGWFTLQFAVQLGDYVGNPAGRQAEVRLRDLATGAQYVYPVVFGGSSLQVVSVPVPTQNRYAVQVVAPQGGSWLTISRTDVQATAPAPL